MPRRDPEANEPASVQGLLDDVDDPQRARRRRARRDPTERDDLDLDKIW